MTERADAAAGAVTEQAPGANDDLLGRVLRADSLGGVDPAPDGLTAEAPEQEGEQAEHAPEPAPLPLATEALAARRKELGMSREDVAAQLKFAARQIQALEEGRFEALPAGTFARGMVRSYARLLKLDPAPVLAQIGTGPRSVSAPMEHAVSLREPVPFSDGSRRVNLVYAVLSIGVLLAVLGLGYDWYRDNNRPAAAPAPVSQNVPQPVATATAALPQAAPPISAEDAAGPPGNATPVAVAATPPVAGGKRRIVMKFDRESWVEVKNRHGATLLSQLNPAGSEKMIEGEAPFSLVIGNAANVRVTYNEQPVDLRPHFKVDVARFTLD